MMHGQKIITILAQVISCLFFNFLRLGFDVRLNHVRFIVQKLALGRFIHGALRSSPVTNIPSFFHSHIHVHVALTRKENREECQPPKNQSSCRNQGILRRLIQKVCAPFLIPLTIDVAQEKGRNKLEYWYVRHKNVYCLHPWATCFNLYTGHLQALLYM